MADQLYNFALAALSQDLDTGWKNDPAAVRAVQATLPYPVFAAAARNLYGSGAGKTTLLYKAYKDVNGGRYIDYPAQTIGDCFPAGTMVLGERIRPIEDVKIGDRVWTAEGKLTTVVSTRCIRTMKPLVRISVVGSTPLTCTADHRMLVYRLPMVGRKRLTPNMAARAGGPGVPKSAKAAYESRRPEWISAGDLLPTDCLLTPVSVDRITPPDSPGGLASCSEGRFVLGYFLGNGSAGGGSAEWTLPSDSVHFDRMMNLLREVDFDPKFDVHKDKNACRIRVHSVEVVRWLRSAFYDGSSKSFPGWAVGDADFLDGLKAADGHGDVVSKIDSTSRSIVQGVMLSLATMGFEPTVNEVSRSEGTYDNAKPLYRVLWRTSKQKQYTWRDEHFVCRPVRRIEFIEGPCNVYDVGVADEHHSFLPDGFGAHNCVSQGFGHGIDLLSAVQIALLKKNEVFKQTCTEAVYGMSRVDIGGGRLWTDGSVGAWAAKAVNTIGTISREVSGPYDGNRARQWGRTGVPAEYKSQAGAHKVGTVSLVTTWSELEDALANGYPVTVCSSRGFTLTRDGNGFCQPKGRWDHCMLIVGVRNDATPGACIFQSWGSDVPSGPLSLDQPPNSFWAERSVVEGMLAMQDSWSLSAFEGYPGQPLPSHWTSSDFAA